MSDGSLRAYIRVRGGVLLLCRETVVDWWIASLWSRDVNTETMIHDGQLLTELITFPHRKFRTLQDAVRYIRLLLP